jgi:ribonuclease E
VACRARIEGEDRDQMRQVMDDLEDPRRHGRHRAHRRRGRAVEELQWDLDNLKGQWDQIDAATKDRPAPYLVYRESDAVTRSLRDYFGDDIGEVLVDDDATFATAQEYMTRFMPPETQKKLKRYTDDIPLFTRFQIESQIESAYAQKVELPRADRWSSTTPRRWCPSTSTPRAPRAARTSRPRRPTPTSKPRTKSRASCASATSVA